MLWNIIDNRRRPYRWREINAIIEAVEHDNTCIDADQAPDSNPLQVVDYDALEAVSVQEAIAWAVSQVSPVTLYLYDSGDVFSTTKHFNAMESRSGGDGENTPVDISG